MANGDLNDLWREFHELRSEGCSKREDDRENIMKNTRRIDTLESKLWWIIALLLGNLAAVITNLMTRAGIAH